MKPLTSASDVRFESIVQGTIDKAGRGQTRIVIAHRFSTITNADRISFLKHGQVAESGTHNHLMQTLPRMEFTQDLLVDNLFLPNF